MSLLPNKRLSSEIQLKRSLTSYINRFMSCHPEMRLTESDIKTLTDKYREWNSCYSKYGRANRFSRKVLYYIAERMYWSRFRDSSYVKLVLLLIFEVDGDLIAIILPYYIDELLSISESDERMSHFTEYFLNHAHRQKVLFDGYRFTSTFFPDSSNLQPVLPVVVQDANSQLLRRMLRFGATFSYFKNYSGAQQSDMDNSIRNPNNLLFLTLIEILRLNRDLLPFGEHHSTSQRYREFITCCQLLLKDISHVSLEELHEKLCPILHNSVAEECLRKDDIMDFTRNFSANIISDFENHFIIPLSLKEIVRLAIRKELDKNWELPKGIYDLPLPERLKIYLDV